MNHSPDYPHPELLFMESEPRFLFTAQAVAEACGVSLRQLHYWQSKGHVPCYEDNSVRPLYTVESVKVVLLIAFGMASGKTLAKVVKQAKAQYPALWEPRLTAQLDEATLNEAAMPRGAPTREDEIASVREELQRLAREMSELEQRLGDAIAAAPFRDLETK